MKSKKLKSKLNKHIKSIPSLKVYKVKKVEDRVKDAISSVPKITDATLPKHREAVLGKARKYIYPLKHSRRHFVRLTFSIIVSVIITFLVFCSLELYYFQSTSSFIYSVSQIIPFPIAKAGPSWISYNSYLFELKRNMHYYITQQQADFSTKDGQAQLKHLKEEAMNQVVLNAYVKQLASKNNISVTGEQVNNEVNLLRQQNRIGNSQQVFNNVLKEYWGWGQSDFDHELSEQLLQQAVVAKLDGGTNAVANSVYSQLKSGANFATLATEYSDDSITKLNGGQYSSPITINDGNVAPQITAALFQLKPGQISGIVNTGFTLEILKVISISGSSITAAHIQFNFQPISLYTNPLQKANPPSEFINI